jgi:hypothetical protein
MSVTNILIIDPPSGVAGDPLQAWLVYRPKEDDTVRIVVPAEDGSLVLSGSKPVAGEAILLAAYTGADARGIQEGDLELAKCLCNFEAGFKSKITHCIVVSNLGVGKAAEIVRIVKERWPNVICNMMDHKTTDGQSDSTWPLAMALRCVL